MDTVKRAYPNLFVCETKPCDLSQESFYGNVEYKRTLVGISEAKIQTYATQMLWRINENGKQAIYWIGVDDNGTKVGVNEGDLVDTIANLLAIASEINASISAIYIQPFDDKYIIKANVRAKTNQSFVFDL